MHLYMLCIMIATYWISCFVGNVFAISVSSKNHNDRLDDTFDAFITCAIHFVAQGVMLLSAWLIFK